MFRWLTSSKKGFTIVELMIVLLLLGFGAFALVNLSTSAWRSFHKTEERYEKQELVKNLVEYMQKKGKISAATSASIYSDLGVLPAEGKVDDSFSYLYCIPVYKNPAPTGDDDKYIEYTMDTSTAGKDWCGYRLYVLNQKAQMPGTCLNPDTPLFVTISVAKGDPLNKPTDADGNKNPLYNPQNLPEIDVSIAATENDAEFIDKSTATENFGYFLPSSSDDIYYGLQVSYHLPNMVANNTVVNSGSAVKTNDGIREAKVVDTGIVLQVTIDSILAGDNSENGASVPSFCFIATASYGHDSGEVGLLCDFRDSVLMQSAPGRAFVKCYYTISPPIAKVIAGSEPLKAAVRAMLKPLVIVATFALDRDLLAANMAYIIILMITAAAAVTVIVYCKKHRREKSK